MPNNFLKNKPFFQKNIFKSYFFKFHMIINTFFNIFFNINIFFKELFKEKQGCQIYALHELKKETSARPSILVLGS